MPCARCRALCVSCAQFVGTHFASGLTDRCAERLVEVLNGNLDEGMGLQSSLGLSSKSAMASMPRAGSPARLKRAVAPAKARDTTGSEEAPATAPAGALSNIGRAKPPSAVVGVGAAVLGGRTPTPNTTPKGEGAATSNPFNMRAQLSKQSPYQSRGQSQGQSRGQSRGQSPSPLVRGLAGTSAAPTGTATGAAGAATPDASARMAAFGRAKPGLHSPTYARRANAEGAAPAAAPAAAPPPRPNFL